MWEESDCAVVCASSNFDGVYCGDDGCLWGSVGNWQDYVHVRFFQNFIVSITLIVDRISHDHSMERI